MIKLKDLLLTTLKWIVLVCLTIFQLGPLVIVLFNSFRENNDVKAMPLGLPDLTYLDNFVDVWVIGGYGRAYLNTAFVAIMVILLVLVLDGLGAYGLSKLNLKYSWFFNGYFFVALSIPGFLYIITVYSNMGEMGLIDTPFSLIIAYTAMQIPFNMILLKTFLMGIPKELEEAAKIDGCNELTAFLRVTLPIAKSIFLTVALLVFVFCWNEYLWSNTFITTDELKTIATRYIKFTGQYSTNMARIYTASVFSFVPIAGIYLIFSRRFIEGMTSGSVKG